MSVSIPHYDADPDAGAWTTARQTGPTVTTFNAEYRVKMYEQTMIQCASSFAALTIGTAGPGASYLYEETSPQPIGADIVTWKRRYSEVPPTRTEGGLFVYPQTLIESTDGSVDWTVELPVSTNSRITYSYFYTTTPDTVTLETTYKMVVVEIKGRKVIFASGSASTPTGWTLAEDEELVRWKGNIWEKKRREVPTAALFSFS